MNECAGFHLGDIYNDSTVSDFRDSTLFATFAPKSRKFLSEIPVVGINLGIVRVKMHGRAKKVVFCDFGDPKNKILIETYFFQVSGPGVFCDDSIVLAHSKRTLGPL